MNRIFLLVLFLSCPALAMDWNGISPLRSTREQVVAILGEPAGKVSELGERFRQDGETVWILWTDANCFTENDKPAASNKNSFVRKITVVPDKPMPMADMDAMIAANPIFFGENKLLRSQMQMIQCFRACGSRDDGIGFGFVSGISNSGVEKIYYFAPTEDWEKWKAGRIPCKAE